MNHNQLGTMAWAQITGGRLRRRDQVKMALDALGIRVDEMARRFLGINPTLARIDVDHIVVPDTSMARAAASLCLEVSSTALANHSLRTYFWAALHASARDIDYDAELLYVAALLHDLGLTDAYANTIPDTNCFAYTSAVVAKEIAEMNAWPEDRCECLGNAICMHMNIRVDEQMGAEAHLLNAGAATDVVGANLKAIPRGAKRKVLEMYPRADLKRELKQSFGKEAQRRPQCRIAFLYANGFDDLIEQAPFSS